MLQIGNVIVCSGLYETFQFVNSFSRHRCSEVDVLKYSSDVLESGVKKLFEGLKKVRHRHAEVEHSLRHVHSNWDLVRKNIQEFFKQTSDKNFSKMDSSMSRFRDSLKELTKLMFFDSSFVGIGRDAVLAVSGTVKHRLSDFSEFLKVKALRNFTLGSYPLLTPDACVAWVRRHWNVDFTKMGIKIRITLYTRIGD